MNKGRKKQSLRRITLLFICLLVLGYLFTGTDLFAREEQEGDYNESIDSEMFTEHPIQLAGFDELPTLVDEERLVENLDEPIQEFSFENKTFQTVVNQPVLLQFSSTLPADEVLIRVPESGQIATEYLTNGEVVIHSHGEYWTLKTQTVQNEFELPVLFDYTGQYFLSIDHDADHFYIEVTDDSQKTKISETEETESLAETNGVEADAINLEEITYESTGNQHDLVLPKIVQEMNLSIPKKLVEMEENRILEETRNADNRSESTVNNWSQFRSAWNNSRTTGIQWGNSNIVFSSSILGDSLNTRSSSISLGSSTGTLEFLNSGNSLNIAGELNLNVFAINAGSVGATPPINVTEGNLIIRNARVINQRFTPAVSAPNMTLGVYAGGIYKVLLFNYQAVSPVRGFNSGSIRISNDVRIGSNAVSQNFIPPIESDSGTNIYIDARNFMMMGRTEFTGDTLRNLDTFSESWNSLNAHLTGINGSVVSSSISDPADFPERYLVNFGQSKYRSLITAATAGEGFDPTPNYTLSLQASPSEGGRPTAETNSLQQGSTTTISANPNEGYRFARWEIVSGSGNIANPLAASTTFTMGSSDTTVRAVYEATSTNNFLYLVASPVEGGSPTAGMYSMLPGEGTMISANPNAGYRFVRWEMVSGIGSIIGSFTSPNTFIIMGPVDTIVRAVYEKEQLEEEKQPGEVHVYHVDEEGHELAETAILTGNAGEEYQTIPAEIKNYQLKQTPENAAGVFSDEIISVVYVYEIEKVAPVDPLDPEVEINPENKPELPENQGLLSIDFASKFQFGRQIISAQDQEYYAEPQRLLNDDGTVEENEERPNYVQISDRRPVSERNGWQLAVTQKEQFMGENEQELTGARIRLTNQQLATAQVGNVPGFQQTNPLSLVPGSRRILLMAQGDEGTGTWIYRFGDENSAGSSVVLDVPRGATPDATSYSTTLTWELSAVPGN